MRNKLPRQQNEIEQVPLGFKSAFFTVGAFSAIQTVAAARSGERTMTNYLLKPVFDRVHASMSED